jgi:hypothetical protein
MVAISSFPSLLSRKTKYAYCCSNVESGGIGELIMTTKNALFVIASLAIVIGALWIGQGTGYFPYPAGSPMINHTPWLWTGVTLAAGGIVLAYWAGRRK